MMARFIDDLQAEAAAAIALMKQAALAARHAHARAELMRHMLTTARKMMHKPKAEAVEAVVREWLGAWNLDRNAWPHIAAEIENLTAAFHDYAHEPTPAHDAALRVCTMALDQALAAEATTISDQMAWRSQCAHGWWEMVCPTPADLVGAKDRPSMPTLRKGVPFWDISCADFCT
ncbi:MAG: hypothetical protein ACRCUE_21405 [Bosea sp. (in: a-proteobacteria)]